MKSGQHRLNRVPNNGGLLAEYVMPAILAAAGLIVLVGAMWRTQRLIEILRTRPPWPSLRNLMLFFAVGYAVYLYALLADVRVNKDLVVGEVFFLSSLFMLLVVHFSYRTIHEIMRLDELEQLANTDELTGMYNRRAIMHILEEEFWKSRRFGFALSVAMVDLDGLKAINDGYMHSAGDVVLREVAQELKVRLRKIDVIGRYGGDEFLCILPTTGMDGAIAMGDRIRERVKRLKFDAVGEGILRLLQRGDEAEGEIVDVTVSVGIAVVDYSMRSPIEAVMAADSALYEAKLGGRDRTAVPASKPEQA